MRGIVATMLWGVAVLALVGVVMPYGMGWLWASRFDEMTARLAVPGYVRVDSSHFERGWFESNARVVLQPVRRFCSAQPCPTLTVESRIVHGPLVWLQHEKTWQPALGVIYSTVDWASLLPRYAVSPQPLQLQATTRVAFDKTTRTRFELEGGEFELVFDRQPQARMQTSTVSGHIPTGADPYRFEGATLNWPRFSLAFEKSGKIAWQDAHLDYRPSGDKAGYRASVHELTLDDGQGNATRLTGVKLHMPPATDDHRMELSLHVDKLVLPNNTQAGLDLRASAHGLDVYPWLMLPQHWAELGGLTGGALIAPELYRRLIPELLPASAELDVSRFRLSTPEGTISGHVKIAAPKAYLPKLTRLRLLNQLQVQAEVDLPDSIIRWLAARFETKPGKENADKRIKGWIKRGLIVPAADNNRYQVRFTLEKGQLSVNGKVRSRWQHELDRMQQQKQSQPVSPVETLD